VALWIAASLVAATAVVLALAWPSRYFCAGPYALEERTHTCWLKVVGGMDHIHALGDPRTGLRLGIVAGGVALGSILLLVGNRARSKSDGD